MVAEREKPAKEKTRRKVAYLVTFQLRSEMLLANIGECQLSKDRLAP
jgi:hypothetical protein